MLIAVSSAPPVSFASYSMPSTVTSLPPSTLLPAVYTTLASTVPGNPSSPSSLVRRNRTLSPPSVRRPSSQPGATSARTPTGSGPSQTRLPHPRGPPWRLLGPLLAASG